MKLSSIIVAAALAIPAVSSFAQSSQAPVTRAQVKSELVQLENAGYNPGTGDHTTYPAQIQAAEAKVSAQNGQSSYGGVADGTSASGSYHAPAHTGATEVDPVYRAH
ncbi:hypothetical protein ASG35_12135 [Burkholderia sp. Leaf177]|uniref:DUF4148 domain-containing protein n=1 Tax=Burkholderia sp. Leaf177 TaxID=1736287 RepID=UPI0006F43C64|nr:DUF4148 domain-containing protein [Burkholderia sp. Leaf177]KQR77247.1 hypothetical protein ASG35_12135 [Burkholderia sp. Leaf177]